MKLLGHSWACINFHKKSINTKFSSIISPNRKHAQGGATRQAEKPVLWPKIQKWQNFLQTPWNLDWRYIIKCHAQPTNLRPRFETFHVFYAASVPSWCMQFQWLSHCLVHMMNVSVMVSQGMYQVYVWFVWKWEIGAFFSMPNVCQRNLRNCEEYRTMGKVNCGK